jgi:hypothetical protein
MGIGAPDEQGRSRFGVAVCRASLVNRLSPAREGLAKQLRLVASMKGRMPMQERRRAASHLAFLICSCSLAPHPIKGHSPQAVRRDPPCLPMAAALKRDL